MLQPSNNSVVAAVVGKKTTTKETKEYSIFFPEQIYKVETITWSVKENQCILAYEPLGRLVYTSNQGKKEVLTIVSDRSGCIRRLLKVMNPNSNTLLEQQQNRRILLDITCCDHSETMKGLCLLCSGDCSSANMIKKLSGSLSGAFTYERGAIFNLPIPTIPTTTTTNNTLSSSETIHSVKSHISLLHNVGYTISYDKGLEKGKANQQRLTEKKKLSLVLDLDHTLLHTINDFEYRRDHHKVTYFNEVYNNSPELQKHVHKFFMRGSYHFVKFRPRLDSFLRRCSELFELHVFTHGERAYADQIGKMLDSSKSLFADRILSRDECPDINTKTLNHIFPYSDKSVLVIDDKTDVWKDNVDNVIQIAPYDYFRRIFGVQLDVNNAPGNDADRKKNNSSAPQRTNFKVIENTIDDYNDDDQLDVIYNILEKVHTDYFKSSSSNNVVNSDTTATPERDVKVILKQKKKEILKGAHIVFSGVIPLKQQPESHPDWRIATDLGANCYTDITPNMTHMVARQKGTEKVKKAEHLPGVHVVDLSWLHACLKYLKKQNEFDYFLSDNKLYPYSEVFSKSKPEIVKFQSVCSEFMDLIQKESAFLRSLESKEVEMDLGSDSDDSSSAASDSDSDMDF